MKTISTLRQRIRTLLTAPGDELGRWAKFAKLNVQLWRLCGRRLRENNAMATSAALSFRTLFAMIPVLVLGVLVLNMTRVMDESKLNVRYALEKAGFSNVKVVVRQDAADDTAEADQPPEETIYITDKIEELVAGVGKKLTLGRIGPVGVVLLIWTALTLLTTMERSLNRIFGAPHSRSLTRRVLIYWSVLTLLPVVLATTFYIGNKMAAVFASNQNISWFLMTLSWAGPFLIGIVGLAIVYSLMPNTDVPLKPAMGAAMVAFPLWMIARWAFGIYVGNVGTNSIYGALGLFPMFLLYLNLSWWIFLFGAELTHAAVSLVKAHERRTDDDAVSYLHLLAASLAVAEQYLDGKGAVTLEHVALRLNLSGKAVQRVMHRLSTLGIVYQVEAEFMEAYILARPAESIAMLELTDMGSSTYATANEGFDPLIAEKIAKVDGKTRESLGQLTLADVIKIA